MSKNVLITGSSSGFGLLIARTLMNAGHTVIATMRGLSGKNAGAANELKAYMNEASGTVHCLELDVTDDASVEAGINHALAAAGHIDVVINNAGFGQASWAESFTADDLHKIFNVNVYGVQRVTRAVLPSMRERGQGLIMNISSLMGRIVLPFAAPYTASKYALEGLTESYRYELAGTGVDVVLVQPGGFGTNFMDNMAGPQDTKRAASYGEMKDMPDEFWGSVSSTKQELPDAQIVADKVLEIIDTAPGERPFRTTVDPMWGGAGVDGINEATSQTQSHLFKEMGMDGMLKLKGS